MNMIFEIIPTGLTQPFGVVPVLVTGGAAVLPAAIGAAAGFIALLFKPKELIRVCRAKPHLPLIALLVVVGLGLLLWGLTILLAPATATAQMKVDPATGSAVQTDWSEVALELIRRETTAPVSLPPEEVAPPATTQTSNRPMIFRVDAQRRGVIGSQSPTNLKLLWEYKLDDCMILSSPIRSGNYVYGAYALLDPPGSFGGIFCLDAQTGREIWITETKDAAQSQPFLGFFSSPAITADGKKLIIGQGLHYDFDCELICLNTETGAVEWLLSTPIHVESSPAITGDMAIVGAGAIEKGPERKPQVDPEGKGNPGYVVAARLSDGQELWRYPVNDPEGSPAIEDNTVYIGSGFNGNAVFALKTNPELSQKERLVWKTDVPHPATGAATLTETAVLIGIGNGDFVFADPNPEGFIVALDKQTGEILWKAKQPDAILGTIAVHEGIAYAPVRNGEVAAVNVKDGSEVWRTRLSDRPVLSGPAVTDTHVYAATTDGYLHILNRSDGKAIEKVYLNDPARPGELGLTFSSPFIVEGTLYIGSETGGLRAYVGTNSNSQ